MFGLTLPGRRARALLSVFVATVLLPWTLTAQEGEPLRLDVRPDDGGVQVVLGDLLSGGGIRGSLDGGLPVRIRLVTELWRDRLLDAQEGRHEWRATVRHDPLSETYRVETMDGVLLYAANTEEAVDILNEELTVPLLPQATGRYYYLARMEVETLSLSDLEELRHWLQGDLTPAIGGATDMGGALGRGLRRLFIRSLGLPAQRYQTRTSRFEWGT